MIDYHKEIVDALSDTGIPVYYEMFLDSSSAIPCVSYMEVDNSIHMESDITDISNVRYQIKVWANNLADLQLYSNKVSTAMRELYFTRTSSTEMSDNSSSLICKIMVFRALSIEHFS